VSLLGTKLTKIISGKDHVLAMNEERELYAWGSNEKGQLGIDAKLTTKEIEFVSFKIDDSAEGG
jgi:alpha-tubulin suppressor-like RCC1 family protein